MNKKLVLICLGVTLLMTGCSGKKTENNNKTNSKEASDVESIPEEKIEIKTKDGAAKVGESFQDPFVDGKLWYTINKSDVYSDIGQAGLTIDDLNVPCNIYSSNDIGEKYRKVSDYITEDSGLVDTHQLLILDVTLRNENALGLEKKSEFNIYDLMLFGGEPVTSYCPAYFSEWGKENEQQPMHYKLEQGKEINIKLGYLVQKTDFDKQELIGMINETQFEVLE